MNAFMPITAKLPTSDDEIQGVLFGHNEIPGDMLVDYYEDTKTVGDETYVTNVRGAEIIGLHIGGNVVLSRDALVQIECDNSVKHLETVYAEERAAQ